MFPYHIDVIDHLLCLHRYRELQRAVVGPDLDLVFTTVKGGRLQHGHVSGALTQMVGAPASATLLRKAQVVSCFKAGGDLASLGRQMKHSPATQQRCYATFEDRANSVSVYRSVNARASSRGVVSLRVESLSAK